jgi:nicotinamidase-related amidase
MRKKQDNAKSMKPCLLIVDMQKHFKDLDSTVFANKLIPNIKKALAIARQVPIPIVHLITIYRRDKTDWPGAWKHRDSIWCLEGTDEAAIIDGLEPVGSEVTVVKTRYSGFFNTDLEDSLKTKGIDSLLFVGYSCDVCLRFTVLDAYNRDYNIHILSDCVHSHLEDTGSSISYLKRLTNCTVSSVDEMKRLLDSMN